jgi:hypothetical protein
MYKPQDRQINFDDFNQPFGLELDPTNRWLKKASLIPWDEIEKRYASIFPSNEGNVAKPARLALGALLIQLEYRFSDEETVAMIQENPYLQYFCGMRGYKSECPFDPSLMVHFRKRFTPEIIGEINEIVISNALQTEEARKKRKSKRNVSHAPKTAKKKDTAPESEGSPVGSSGEESSAIKEPGAGDEAQEDNACVNKAKSVPADDEPPSNNKGTLIVDATCAPSYIKYPQDTDLLEQARLKTEKIISEQNSGIPDKRPRTYTRKARKEYNGFSRKRRKTRKEIRKMTGKELRYLRRNLSIIEFLLLLGAGLSRQLNDCLEVLKTLYTQQMEMYTNKSHKISARIVSLSQPWLRPIIRGKATAPVEFGVKLDISVVNGYTRLEYASFDAYNESTLLTQEIERYKAREGFYPQRVLADKIYRNRENLKYCRERGIRLSGPALGRPPKGYVPDKKLEYQDSCDRTEVERRFSLAKRKYGMGKLYTKLQDTSMSTVALSVLLLNLNKVFLCFQLLSLFSLLSQRKRGYSAGTTYITYILYLHSLSTFSLTNKEHG